jgi:hypothetical protein
MSGGGLRKRRTPFVQVDRRTVRDGRLSFRALGGLTYLLDRPDGWDVRAEQMSTSGEGREGREAVRTLLRELSAAGYYRLERRRMRDGTFAMGTAVSEDAVESWAAQFRFFGGKAVPMVEQEDGTFLVRYPDGTLAPDDFPPPEAPEQDEPTGAQKPVSGEDDHPPGPGNPASGEPGPGKASPLEDATRDMREEREDQNPTSGTVGAEGTGPTRGRARGGAAPPRAGRPPQPGPAAKAGLAVLAKLPRPWRDCPPWVRRRMAERLQRVLDAGVPASAVLAAVDRYAPSPGDVLQLGAAERVAGRHVWALAHVLRLLAADLAAGDLPAPADPGGWLVVDGDLCVACNLPGGRLREDLPLAVPVHDGCFERAEAGREAA